MSIGILDQIGVLITNLGFDPVIVSILAAFGLALYPPIKRGVLDDRLEDIGESVDYSLLILTLGFMVAFYFQFGLTGVKEELLGITGGFIVGTFVVRTISRLTGIE